MATYSVSAKPLYYSKRPQCGVIWDERWMIFILFPLNSSQELQISNFKYLRQLKVSYKFIWKHVFSGHLSIALTKKGLHICCYYCCWVFDTNFSSISTRKKYARTSTEPALCSPSGSETRSLISVWVGEFLCLLSCALLRKPNLSKSGIKIVTAPGNGSSFNF